MAKVLIRWKGMKTTRKKRTVSNWKRVEAMLRQDSVIRTATTRQGTALGAGEFQAKQTVTLVTVVVPLLWHLLAVVFWKAVGRFQLFPPSMLRKEHGQKDRTEKKPRPAMARVKKINAMVGPKQEHRRRPCPWGWGPPGVLQ